MRFYEFITEAPTLAPGELFKYVGTRSDRVPLFLKKIQAQEPFTVKTANGFEEIVLDPAEYDRVEAWTKSQTGSIKIKARDDSRMIPIGSLKKTKEFGGEEAGRREKIEQGQIEGIAQELETAKAGAPYIKLTIGDNTVNAASVEKERGTVNGLAPKSDMTVLDENGNPVAWVSLKDNNFRWGGWQHLIKNTSIADWLNRVREVTGGVFQPKQSFGLHTDDETKQQIVYGKNFGGPRGFSNVDAVLIGWTHIKKNGEKYTLSADTIYKNGDVPSGTHTPYLVMRYALNRPDLGFKNVRAETNTASETRNVKWLDTDADIEKTKNMFADEEKHRQNISGLKPKERAVANKEFKAKQQVPATADKLSIPPNQTPEV